MSDIKVRKAIPEDARDIKEIHIQTQLHSYRGVLPDEILDGMKIDDESVLKTSKKIENTDYFVACEDDKIVGFAVLGYPEDKVVEIEVFYVSPKHHHKGIGTKIVDYVSKLKSSEGFDKIIAWTLKTGPSIGFYKKYGFNQIEGLEKIWKFDLPIIKFEKEFKR